MTHRAAINDKDEDEDGVGDTEDGRTPRWLFESASGL
eukprot:CAMPEP_0171853124 /NCGR_PEP_ID=MMETSP0992-20121227/22064_1 /TAXON_ID=483369 /ORGANISM="non described non described, Strain CCMP2098" /LENGTH=36 /DNA_ID= /DNA_START= /DNA_END= /DNA_ORIENTATION=